MKQPYLNRARAWRGRPTEEETGAALAAQTPIESSPRRLTFGERPPPADPRAEPLPLAIDDAGLAQQVQSTRTPEGAWDLLGLPGGRGDLDPGAVAALAAATTELCATSDAIGKGLAHLGALAPGAPVPPSWVDRMVDLYAAELEGYWVLDDLAYAGLAAGGWTVTTTEPPDPDPVARVARRARWQAAHLKPKDPALWFDKLDRALGRAVTDAQGDPAGIEAVRDAGRALVQESARRRFAGWQQHRRTT